MKKETLKEFLARGGVIKRVPAVERPHDPDVKSMAVGPAVVLTLEEGDLFYGEKKKSTVVKEPKAPKVNFSDLPEALRNKLLARSKRSGDDV